ncbi:MAG: cytochrome c [Campylobacterota bacterium]|nr:cytochrome c [Campylobacterota bacterium]
MKLFKWFFLPLFLWGNEDFITKDEYASQLYNNPRGISCALCHNRDGSHKLIAKYTHDNEEKYFQTPDITSLSYEDFHRALNRRIRGMPRYFLTDNEIKLLYYYLQQRKI